MTDDTSANQPTERTGPRRGLVGRVIGDRYTILRVVSAGSDTVIADAEDGELNRLVQVKLVRPEWAESAQFRNRFARTMKAMSRLSHPNVAVVYDWGEEEIGRRTTVYAIVEPLTGGSLRDLFDRGRLLDPSQALLVGLEACRGLDFAHSKGLIHTELTPAKLVFGDDRRLRITDFGLARLLGAQDWSESATVATHVARYASPEQALAQPVDAKTDVYSLALILVEAVTGSVPFAAGSTVATLSARVGRLMPVSADLGPLASVLERAGRPEPEERSTAAELGRGLVRTAEKLPRPTPIPVLAARLLDEDPEKLRRPNDPTGGVHRPEDSPAARAAALAAGAGAAAAAAAAASVVGGAPAPGTAGVVEGSTGAAGAPEGGEATGDAPAEAPEEGPQPGSPDVEGSAAAATAGSLVVEESPAGVADVAPDATPDEAAPRDVDDVASTVPADTETGEPDPAAPLLYDGDADATTDELAALARPPDEHGEHPPVPPAPADPVVPSDPEVDVTGPPGRRRRWWPWLAGLLVLVALGGLSFLAYRLFRTPTHEVPALAGLTEADATRLTDGFDWELDVELERSDEEPDAGQIIRTAPGAGEQLAEGEPFLIVVSEGPELRALPDLVGQPLADAETNLAQLRLVALPATEQFDEEAPLGEVVSWSVPADADLGAGDEVLPETEVAIVVSAGPAPRVLPDLTGLSLADATAQLEGQQLVVAVAEAQFSDSVPVGGVVGLTPPPATSVERGSTVTLVPSKGVDLVTMPDLTGQNLPQMQATLAAAGLNLGSLLGSTQGIFVSASVAGEDAAPGDQFKRGSAVDIVLL